MQTTDKVQTGESTTGTSTSTSYTYNNHPYNAEKGWECPRCHHINAPWVRQCDCSTEWKITCDDTIPNNDWWKYYVKATQADCVGGSDYFNPNGAFWSNISKIVSNIKEIY